ncbi:MAG: hypothetical protein LRS43_02280 [Desulfurococcales archaeon]|nr:hypothetical protein [Desulfurococcales archaeon]
MAGGEETVLRRLEALIIEVCMRPCLQLECSRLQALFELAAEAGGGQPVTEFMGTLSEELAAMAREAGSRGCSEKDVGVLLEASSHARHLGEILGGKSNM